MNVGLEKIMRKDSSQLVLSKTKSEMDTPGFDRRESNPVAEDSRKASRLQETLTSSGALRAHETGTFGKLATQSDLSDIKGENLLLKSEVKQLREQVK